jgi:toxin ParE1/3/4
MVRVRVSDEAQADIREAVHYTRRKWGRAKAAQYRELLRDARTHLAREPQAGKPAGDDLPGWLVYRIAQRGKDARHVLLYRIAGDGSVQIARFLYDGMKYSKHVPDPSNG